MSNPPQLADTLFASGPHPSLGEHAQTYGRLIGSWSGTYRDLTEEGERTGSMEVHFGWVLEGRAIQDTWIAPRRGERSAAAPDARSTYGTTLRVFEPALGAWRILWLHPTARGLVRSELIGRRIGDDIVQTGLLDEAPAKWNFTDITPRSFTWRAYSLAGDGVAWTLQTEFLLSRTA